MESKASSCGSEINLQFPCQLLNDVFDLNHHFGRQILEDDPKDRIKSSKIVERFCDQTNQLNTSLTPSKEPLSNDNRDNKEMEDITISRLEKDFTSQMNPFKTLCFSSHSPSSSSKSSSIQLLLIESPSLCEK